jgi:hypothetical protein
MMSDAEREVSDDAALTARAGEALRMHGDKQWDFSMAFTTAFQIASQLQLALRHPDNNGGAALAAQTFIKVIASALRIVSPDLEELLKRGDDPSHNTIANAWPKRIAGAIALTDAKISYEIAGGTLDARTALAVLSYVRFRLAFLGSGLDDLLAIPQTEEAAQRAVQAAEVRDDDPQRMNISVRKEGPHNG